MTDAVWRDSGRRIFCRYCSVGMGVVTRHEYGKATTLWGSIVRIGRIMGMGQAPETSEISPS